MRRTKMGMRTTETTAPSIRRATRRIQNPPYRTPPGAVIVTPGTAGARVPPQRVQKLAAALTAWPHWLQKAMASVMGQEYIAAEKVGKWQATHCPRTAELLDWIGEGAPASTQAWAKNARQCRYLR